MSKAIIKSETSRTARKSSPAKSSKTTILSGKGKIPSQGRQSKTQAISSRPRYYQRFHWTQRIAHALLLTSFTLLGLTGLPQKYPSTDWGQLLIKIYGGIETTRLIHHVSATVLMLLAIYHLLDLGYKILVRRVQPSMLPGIKDAKDGVQAFGYNLGLVKKRPQMGRYTFEEKLEYWALVWGTIIMGITGFMMWNPIATTKFLPGEIIPASKTAHGGEAILAVAAIIIWHMYGVHIKRFNKAMFTGQMTEEDMRHEHPIELADLKAGISERSVDRKTLRKRQLIYWPVASLLAIVMLFGVYGFVGAEKTAISTVPSAQASIPVYLPRTPTPTATPDPVSGALILTWDDSISNLLQSKCSACHGPASITGFSMDSYNNFMIGGNDGPIIVPGDPDASLLVQLQSAGGHPGQLNDLELTAIKEWIIAGAPEK
jgi:cytochrome b subunit of formate dehydrogenase